MFKFKDHLISTRLFFQLLAFTIKHAYQQNRSISTRLFFLLYIFFQLKISLTFPKIAGKFNASSANGQFSAVRPTSHRSFLHVDNKRMSGNWFFPKLLSLFTVKTV